jgi:alpha-D-ribose 1-methylphosphonate 5-triphosphate synthase subunit PhnH
MSDPTKKYSFNEVFDSQRVYRLILTAMSNPTRTVNIKEFADKLYGDYPDMLAIAMSLLDNEVSFFAYGIDGLSEEILSLTLSRRESAENADYIFVAERNELVPAIESAKCGTLRDPHKSATLIVRNVDTEKCRLRLRGAGIREEAEFETTELVKIALETRDRQFYEYPQGIDFIFVSENGELLSIPRLTLWEVL